MKKMLVIFTIMFNVMLPVTYGESYDDCSISSDEYTFLPNLFSTNCKIENGDQKKYCNCLKTSNNILIRALSETQRNQLEKDQNNLKEEYSNKLNKVFFQMNYGVHLQQQSLGIKKTGGQTACLPEKFAENFTASICQQNSQDKNDCEEKEIQGELVGNRGTLDDCNDNNSCPELYSEINHAWEQKKNQNQNKNWTDKSVRIAANGLCTAAGCGESKAIIGSSDRQPDDINNASTLTQAEPSDSTASSSSNTCSLSDTDKDDIQKMIIFFNAHSKIVDKSTVENLNKIKNENQICGNENLYSQALKEFKFKSKYSTAGSQLAKGVHSKEQNDIKTMLEKQIKEGKDILENGFKKATAENACVPYDKYKVMASAPAVGLIDQWSSMTEDEIAKSLDPVTLKNSSSPSLDFIRNNPMLVNIVIGPESRKQLAAKLKTFSGSNKGKGKSVQLSGYLDFMKTEVPGITTGVMALHQCNLLARNAAAVFSSNLFPGEVKFENTGSFTLKENLYACAMIDQQANKNVTSSLKEIMDSNALFDLMLPQEGGTINDPNNDINYKNFLDANCKGFADFKKKHIAKYCKMLLMGSKCEEKFETFAKSRSKKLLIKYFEKDENRQLGEMVQIVSDSVDEADFDELDDMMKLENQDHLVSQEYETKIKPYINSSIYDFSDAQSRKNSNTFDEIAKMQADYDKRAASSSTGRGTSLSDLSNYDTNSNKGNSLGGDPITNTRKSINSPNAGQVVPNYLSNSQSQNAAPVMESRNITSLKQANDLVDKVTGKEGANLRPENKAEIVKNVQKYIDGTKDNSNEMTKLQDKILDLEDQISEDRKNKTNGRSTASLGAGYAPQVNPSSMKPMNQNFTGAIPFAPGFSPAPAAGGKIQRAQAASAASYQKALNDKYIQSEKDSTPYNSSNDQFVLNKEPYVGAGGEELLVGLELSPSKKEFSKIVDSEANLLKYLNENLIKIPGSKIISIKCGPQCDDKANDLLLHIDRDKFNKIVVRSVASSSPVVRVHKLDILNKEFKGIK